MKQESHDFSRVECQLTADIVTGERFDFDCVYTVGHDDEKNIITINIEKPERSGNAIEYDYLTDPMKVRSGRTYFYRMNEGGLELLDYYEYVPDDNNGMLYYRDGAAISNEEYEKIAAPYADCSFTYVDTDNCFYENNADEFRSNYEKYIQ